MTWDQQLALTDEKTDIYWRLRTYTGCPARITIETSAATEPIKVSGCIDRVVITGILVDLETSLPLISADTKVTVEALGKQALLQFEAFVSEVDDAQRLYLTLPEQITTLQRRTHPRVDVHLETSMTPDSREEAIPIQVVNLSAGGAAYSSYVPLPVGSTVTLHLAALALAPADIPARVVRCAPVDGELWILAVAFHTLNPAQEAKIAQYVSTILEQNS